MGLITEEVEVILSSKTIEYFEKLGYEIPRRIDKYNVSRVKRGSKIKVKVLDLMQNSNALVDVECDNCKKIMLMKYEAFNLCRRNEKYYCNQCKNIFNRGKHHYNWKPNKTDEERLYKRLIEGYTEFVKRVLERDNYTCQFCGNKINHNAEVHHLDGFDWCKEKRLDDTNGITLCKTCHKNFHSVYGYGGNTKSQYEQWVGKSLKLIKYMGEIPTTRPFYCFEDGCVYSSVIKYAKENKFDSSKIYKVCNKKQNTYKGKHYMWYDEYLEKFEIEKQNEILNRKDGK